ncbi:MAG: hypothetical protein ACRDQA_22015 [Nocardioidaceae bacterium]
MITRVVRAGAPASWVAGDEVYGADPTLHRAVRAAGLGYVLQVAANRRVPTGAGTWRVDQIAADLAGRAWQNAVGGGRQQGRTLPLLGVDHAADRG